MIPNQVMICLPFPYYYNQTMNVVPQVTNIFNIQLIEYQMCNLKMKIEKLRKKRKLILTKKKIKSSRKSQMIKSNISQPGMKSLRKHNSSSIQWSTSLENSRTSNSSIVEPSNKEKKSWNNSNFAKASSCSWTEVQTKNQFVNQSSS